MGMDGILIRVSSAGCSAGRFSVPSEACKAGETARTLRHLMPPFVSIPSRSASTLAFLAPSSFGPRLRGSNSKTYPHESPFNPSHVVIQFGPRAHYFAPIERTATDGFKTRSYFASLRTGPSPTMVLDLQGQEQRHSVDESFWTGNTALGRGGWKCCGRFL